MANIVTTAPPLDNNNEISANEQVINSPPHLNRLAGGNISIMVIVRRNHRRKQMDNQLHKKTVTKLLKNLILTH